MRCCARSPLAYVASTRASDTWARLGGDEFALVQEGVTELDAPDHMARRVLAGWKHRS